MTANCDIALSLADVALAYVDAGLSVIATREDKRPVAAWKQYQTTRPNGYQIAAMFADDHAHGLAVICGGISDGLECIDFDGGGKLWEPWTELVEDGTPGLLSRLPVETSPSGGKHVFYRVAGGAIPGNTKLAARVNDAGGTECLIETRGEGGYFCTAPTPGYTIVDGDLADVPVITFEERDVLIRSARVLDERPIRLNETISRPADGRQGGGDTQRPGDDFNRRGDVRSLLHGMTGSIFGRLEEMSIGGVQEKKPVGYRRRCKCSMACRYFICFPRAPHLKPTGHIRHTKSSPSSNTAENSRRRRARCVDKDTVRNG